MRSRTLYRGRRGELARLGHEGFERGGGAAVVERGLGGAAAGRDRVGAAGRVDGRAGVEDAQRTARAALAGEDGAGRRSVGGGVAAGEVVQARGFHTDLRGLYVVVLDPVPLYLDDVRGRGDAHLVQSVG